jgi:hypothetical protein
LPCFTDIPGLSRSTSAAENDGRLSNWLRLIVVSVWPLGARYRLARASLGVTPAPCDTAGVAMIRLGRARVLADERALGRRATGFATGARGASTVTGGNAVCALVLDGAKDSALQSTSRLAHPGAR